ncbi:DUF1127 domain-containing protein [Salinarimonas soli]|uniref:DUF1127 domain-containing protein n=1 Tax=Salinarimonas soli TaxID=1638099 RepID=A0A5B2VGU5_9HYPH|nr:DUF1127 domain-containing protein [Salinarimonas soli]KAA2237562.1 DUF1127 domain-containing protein [Salinarimonas soli]
MTAMTLVSAPALGRAVALLRRRWMEHRTARALDGLDDRMLSDIGLHRSEAASIAHQGEADTTRIPR